MIRTSLLKAVAVGGLLLLGVLVFWWVRTPAEQRLHESQPLAGSVPAKIEMSGTERLTGSVLIPNGTFLSAGSSIRNDLESVLAEVEAGTNALQFEFQAGKFQEFVENIPTNDFAAVFGELSELQKLHPTAAGQDLQLRLLQRWSEFDVRAAAQGLARMGAEDRPEACERVATVWARQNLSEAVSWAQQLPEGNDRQSALLSIVYEAAYKDPKEALLLASQLPVPAEKRDLIAQAASTWAADAPDTAAEWAEQIQDQPMREQVMAAIAISWADKDPISAAHLVLESLSEGQEQQNAVLGIIQRLTFKDVEAANAWVAQFPEGSLRETALAEMNRILARQRLVQARTPELGAQAGRK